MTLELKVAVVLCLFALATGLPLPKRVIGAWMVWFRLRWQWRYKRRLVHRWLWAKTLRRANGTDTETRRK